jgi:hypothetical protein
MAKILDKKPESRFSVPSPDLETDLKRGSRKKTRRWEPEMRSSERKPVVRVLKRGCTLFLTNTEFFFLINF